MSNAAGAGPSRQASARSTVTRSASPSAAMLRPIAATAATGLVDAQGLGGAARRRPPARRHRCPRTGRGSGCRAAAAGRARASPNSASRARSLVGRVARPSGVSIRRPRCRPAMIRRLTPAPRPPRAAGARGRRLDQRADLLAQHLGQHLLDRALGQEAELERARRRCGSAGSPAARHAPAPGAPRGSCLRASDRVSQALSPWVRSSRASIGP